MKTIAIGVAACGVVFASGCVRDLNARPVLGGQLQTSTFGGGSPAVEGAGDLGVDRSAWPGRVFLVPVDGTVHGPAFEGGPRWASATHREQGLFPTAETALELEGPGGGTRAAQGAAEPLVALGEVLWMPIGLVLDPPWTLEQSPNRLYKRSRQGGWWSGTAASAPGAPAPTGGPSEGIEAGAEGEAP